MSDIAKLLEGLKCLATNEVPCEGCSYYGSGYCLRNIAEDAIRWLTARDSAAWVSVKDRLPRMDEDVLVCAKNKITGDRHILITSMFDQTYYTSEPTKHEPRWREPYQYFNMGSKITHWRPLPELPEEADDETVGRWIDVGDALPDTFVDVLTTVFENNVMQHVKIAYLDEDGTWLDDKGDRTDVTHWMCIPVLSRGV